MTPCPTTARNIDSNYTTATGTNGTTGLSTVATAGKQVPLTPDWLEKFVASTSWGAFEAQLNGDYIGRRYTTYLNDMQVSPTFVMGLEASYLFELPPDNFVKTLKLSGNVTNLGNEKGVSTAVVTGASGGYQAYPLTPRMWFVTLQAGL